MTAVDTARELKPLEVTAAITMGGGTRIAAAPTPPSTAPHVSEPQE